MSDAPELFREANHGEGVGMNRETIPTFIFKGETLVDVAFTEWDIGSLASYLVVGTTVELSGNADKVTFELPYGCKEVHVSLHEGDRLNISGKSGGRVLQECERAAVVAHQFETVH